MFIKFYKKESRSVDNVNAIGYKVGIVAVSSTTIRE